jgi:DNA primase catalytic core
MYSDDFIAKVKAAVDIVDIVGEAVQLRRSGKYFTGLSPFTKEKTPSFFVNPETQSFKCFSTGEGGDVFTFLKLTKGLNFPEAINALAEKIGMDLEQTNKSPEQIAQDKRIAEERKAALKLNKFAARFYQDQLEGPGGAAARDYVQKRGILPESVLAFAIGFAPDSWTALRDFFLKIKAPMVPAYELGLFRTRGNEKPKADGSNLFDTFRNRLIFPIRDPQGEVLGFGGRWLGPTSADAPKYLNSLESSVYEKDRILYNLDLARKSIRELETVVLVEGYMDCLALFQVGFTNVVANCGTALTRSQAGLLRKLAPKVICLYDSDKAGQAAMEKAMNLFLDSEGLPLLGAHLPDGKDPDEFLRTHGEEGQLRMAKILQNSPALLDEWIAKNIKDCPKTLQARTEILIKIAGKLSKLRDDLSIQTRLPGLATGLELDADLLIDAVRKFKKGFLPDREIGSFGGKRTNPNAKTLPMRQGAILQKSRQIQGASGKRDIGFQRRFLSDLLRNPTWLESLRKMPAQERAVVLTPVDDPGVQQALSKILEPLQPNETEGERIGTLLNAFREQPDIRNLVAEASMRSDDELPQKDLESSLKRLRLESLVKREAEIREKISKAEIAGDAQAGDALLAELTAVRRQRAQN